MDYRLIYVSSISTEGASHFESTVEDILVESVANNRRDRITGFLLADGFTFVQALEGPRDLVEACYGRIAVDPRHVRPVVYERTFVEARLFDRWSMCGLSLSTLDDLLLPPAEIEFDFRSASPGALLQHLRSIALRYAIQLDAEHARLLDVAASRKR